MDTQIFWMSLSPREKVSLMHVASDLGNPTAVAYFENVPELVKQFLRERPGFTRGLIPEWKAPVENLRRVYVEIGHPAQKPPSPTIFVEMDVEPGEEIEKAKLARIEVTKNLGNFGLAELRLKYGMKFKPSDFYWAVFENFRGEKPIVASDNWYWRRKDFSRAPGAEKEEKSI